MWANRAATLVQDVARTAEWRHGGTGPLWLVTGQGFSHPTCMQGIMTVAASGRQAGRSSRRDDLPNGQALYKPHGSHLTASKQASPQPTPMLTLRWCSAYQTPNFFSRFLQCRGELSPETATISLPGVC